MMSVGGVDDELMKHIGHLLRISDDRFVRVT